MINVCMAEVQGQEPDGGEQGQVPLVCASLSMCPQDPAMALLVLKFHVLEVNLSRLLSKTTHKQWLLSQ